MATKLGLCSLISSVHIFTRFKNKGGNYILRTLTQVHTHSRHSLMFLNDEERMNDSDSNSRFQVWSCSVTATYSSFM